MALSDSDNDIEIIGASMSKKRKLSGFAIPERVGQHRSSQAQSSKAAGPSQTKKLSQGGSSRSALSAALSLSSSSRMQPMSTTSALKSLSSARPSSSASSSRPSQSVKHGAGPSRAGPSNPPARSNAPSTSLKSSALSSNSDRDEDWEFTISSPERKPVISHLKGPRASTGNLLFTSKPRLDNNRRKTISGGLTLDEAIVIESSDDEPVKKAPLPTKVIVISDSDDDDSMMNLDPPTGPEPPSPPSTSMSEPVSEPEPPTPIQTSRLISVSQPTVTQKPESTADPKGKIVVDQTPAPSATKPPSTTTLPPGQADGMSSQPESSKTTYQPRTQRKSVAWSSMTQRKSAARSDISPKPIFRGNPSPPRAAPMPPALLKSTKNLINVMVSLGLDSEPAQPVDKGKGKAVDTSSRTQASSNRPLFLPSTTPPPTKSRIEKLTDSFEALASSPNKFADAASSKVAETPLDPRQSSVSSADAQSDRVASSIKRTQTARKSTHSSAFVPKPRLVRSPPVEEASGDSALSSSKVVTKLSKKAVTTISVSGSGISQTTTETTAFKRVTGRAAERVVGDNDFFQTTTHASGSSDDAARPSVPKRRKTDTAREVSTHRTMVTVEEDDAGNRVVSAVDEHFTVQRKLNPPRKARPRVGVTSLKQKRLAEGQEWYNPYDEEPKVAMPLETTLADSMNRTPGSFADDPSRRAIFEEMIRTRDRGAPPIKIINEIDAEPCPPFEFDWRNDMLYGEDVPRKNIDVQGCGCRGPCDPFNKACACIAKHEKWIVDSSEGGFAYGLDRQLVWCHVPVFECNDACGCTEECSNRVVQHGRQCKLLLKKTDNKGWGVFADEYLPTGRFIGVYSGELITNNAAHIRGLLYDKLGRTYLFNLDFAHLREGSTAEKSPSNSKESSPSGDGEKAGWQNVYTVDAFHAGNHTRFLNHSCDPNVEFHPIYTDDADVQKPLLCAFTSKDVQRGEELCFSYFDGDENDSPENDNAERARCLCGANNCKGFMFKYCDGDQGDGEQGDADSVQPDEDEGEGKETSDDDMEE